MTDAFGAGRLSQPRGSSGPRRGGCTRSIAAKSLDRRVGGSVSIEGRQTMEMDAETRATFDRIARETGELMGRRYA